MRAIQTGAFLDDNDNPYASPRSASQLIPSSEPRRLGYGVISLVGMAVGAVSFVISMFLIPSNVPSTTEHDLRLANHLGFIYPALVGLWAAWVRRSVPWAIIGVFSGLTIGAAYYALCGEEFFAVMVWFPCLLGGCTSVLLGTKRDSWTKGVPQRFSKGLVAGFVLGFVYAVVLNVLGAFIFFILKGSPDSVADYSSMMWRSGTIAMAAASGLYFILLHWSAGLHPVPKDANEQRDEREAAASVDSDG